MADLFEELGLKPGDPPAPVFKPTDISDMFGEIRWNPKDETFYSTGDWRTKRLFTGLFDQFRNTTPDRELSLFRRQFQPVRDQMYQDLESRLFSQGRLGASSSYQPGGEMRGLFDSFNNQDMLFQQQAMANARAERMNILNQILGLGNLQAQRYGSVAQLSGLSNQGALQNAQMQFNQSAFIPNMIWSGVGGFAQGYGSTFGGGDG